MPPSKPIKVNPWLTPSIVGKFRIEYIEQHDRKLIRLRIDGEDLYPKGSVGAYLTIDIETMEIFIFPSNAVEFIKETLDMLEAEQKKQRLLHPMIVDNTVPKD